MIARAPAPRAPKVRTLIVDDSATMRSVIAALLAQDPRVDVIGRASCVAEARTMIRELNPDVVTLDIEMPGMDGLSFLDKIMRLRPTPVVIVSSLTAKGAESTLRALELGAVDCYAKPVGGLSELIARDGGRLAKLVVQASGSRERARPALAPRKAASDFRWNGRMVAIAASTGGVEALTSLLHAMPENCPPILVVQHMAALYTKMLATRLNRDSAPVVVEATHNAQILQGHVYIAPGGSKHLTVEGRGQPLCKLREGDPVNGHRPSGDYLFNSIAQRANNSGLGVILTGMGEDGARGLLAMRQAGFPTIGQDRDTALIYGMPRAAAEMGGVGEALPLDKIAPRILELCSL